MYLLAAFDISLELGAIAVFAVVTIATVAWRSAVIVTRQDITITKLEEISNKMGDVEDTTQDHGERIKVLEEKLKWMQ